MCFVIITERQRIELSLLIQLFYSYPNICNHITPQHHTTLNHSSYHITPMSILKILDPPALQSLSSIRTNPLSGEFRHSIHSFSSSTSYQTQMTIHTILHTHIYTHVHAIVCYSRQFNETPEGICRGRIAIRSRTICSRIGLVPYSAIL